MKFLYSHRTRSADGQYIHIKALSDALLAAGHDVVMAGPDVEDGQSAGSKKLSAGGRSGLRDKLPGAVYECAEFAYSMISRRRLGALARSSTPDVLYERYNLYHHAGVDIARAFNLPLILEVNAPLVDERMANGELALPGWARRSENAIWRAADHILPVTNVLAEIVRRAGVPDEKITVIQNGVEPIFLQTVDASPIRQRYNLGGKLVLGFTGFVRDWHGVDRVLRFMASMARDDLHLLLVGDGPERANLESLAGSLGIGDHFTVTGVVQRPEMAAHVGAMDIALQPAVVPYASPLKLFEYMGQARAIIAPDQANIREVLQDDVDALLFSQDANDFDRKLKMLIDDEALRLRLGSAAKESLLRQELTWSANARRVEAIAEKLLREK